MDDSRTYGVNQPKVACELMSYINGHCKKLTCCGRVAALIRAVGPASGGALWSWSTSEENKFDGSVYIAYSIVLIAVVVKMCLMYTSDPSIGVPYVEETTTYESMKVTNKSKRTFS